MAEYAVHRHLNDRFGMLITQQDLTTTTWSKFDQDHPHVSNVGICACISLSTETG